MAAVVALVAQAFVVPAFVGTMAQTSADMALVVDVVVAGELKLVLGLELVAGSSAELIVVEVKRHQSSLKLMTRISKFFRSNMTR